MQTEIKEKFYLEVREVSNNSIEFIKKRILENGTYGIGLNELENATELSWNQFRNNKLVDYMLNNKTDCGCRLTLEGSIEDKMKLFEIEMHLSPCEKFDYFTMESCVSDGTLLFHFDLVERCLMKIIELQTYCTAEIPRDFYEYPEKYIVRYYIGNPVICTDISDKYASQNKKWMTEKVITFVPIKNDFIRK